MKSSLRLTCGQCGNDFQLEFSGSRLPECTRCTNPDCNAVMYSVEPLGNFAAMLMMERARHELANGDNTFTILLGAMAVESEMAFLFFKWKGIDSRKLPINQTDRGAWEAEWADMRSISRRLDELSRLLTKVDFDKFAIRHMPAVVAALDKFDPSGSLKAFFQEQLFSVRNQIVHYGRIDFGKDDAERCLRLASSLLGLLNAMDKERVKRMDEDHKKTRECIS